MIATSRPSAFAASRTSVARSTWSEAFPCEKLRRTHVDAGREHARQHGGIGCRRDRAWRRSWWRVASVSGAGGGGHDGTGNPRTRHPDTRAALESRSLVREPGAHDHVRTLPAASPRAATLFSRRCAARVRLRRSGREEDVHAAVVHDRRRQDDPERARRLRDATAGSTPRATTRSSSRTSSPGTSHAAGKYQPTDAAPGYWDAIIGSGRPIDTDKYFVVSADAFANLNTKDPNVVTTGPATINPATGKPYGLSFPVVSYRDTRARPQGAARLARRQAAARGRRRVRRLDPGDGVGRALPRLRRSASCTSSGPGFDITPFVVEMLDVWTTPIRMDPKWNNGDYYGGRRAAGRRRQRAQDHHDHDARARLGREDVRLQAGRPGEGSGGGDGATPFAIEDALAKAGARALARRPTRTRSSTRRRRTSSTGSPTTR